MSRDAWTRPAALPDEVRKKLDEMERQRIAALPLEDQVREWQNKADARVDRLLESYAEIAALKAELAETRKAIQ